METYPFHLVRSDLGIDTEFFQQAMRVRSHVDRRTQLLSEATLLINLLSSCQLNLSKFGFVILKVRTFT